MVSAGEKRLTLPANASIEHEVVVYEPGAIVLKQGEVGQRFFIVQSGRAEVVLEAETDVALAVLQVGNFFGEFSCLTGQPVSATIRALDTLTVQVIERDGLLQLLDAHPAFMRHVLNELLQRMSKSNVRVKEETLRTNVLIESALADKKDQLGELVARSEAMQQVEEQIAELARSAQPVLITGESGTGKEFIANMLHYRSTDLTGPVLKVSAIDFNWDEWRRKLAAAHGGTLLLTHSDALPLQTVHDTVKEQPDHTRLILTAAKRIPGLDVAEIRVPPLRERYEDLGGLIRECLQRDGVGNLSDPVSGPAFRKLISYPFLDGNVKELFDVIHRAAIMSGGETIQSEHVQFSSQRVHGSRPKIGLALGAGVVRGFAHIGVLRALIQEGIPIDLIAGCSIGAIIGSFFASGKSLDEIEQIWPTLGWGNFVSVGFPRTGVLNTTRMEKWVIKHLGNVRIEDMPIPFAAVATDGETGMPVILKSGPVAPAVRASASIPVMMKPITHEGRLLWDGGLVHKVPVHLARSMGANVVIAVDVGFPAFKKRKVRNLVDALTFPLEIMQEAVAQEELELADVVLRPGADVSGYSFKNMGVFVKQGEDAAREAMPRIRKAIARVMEA